MMMRMLMTMSMITIMMVATRLASKRYFQDPGRRLVKIERESARCGRFFTFSFFPILSQKYGVFFFFVTESFQASWKKDLQREVDALVGVYHTYNALYTLYVHHYTKTKGVMSRKCAGTRDIFSGGDSQPAGTRNLPGKTTRGGHCRNFFTKNKETMINPVI